MTATTNHRNLSNREPSQNRVYPRFQHATDTAMTPPARDTDFTLKDKPAPALRVAFARVKRLLVPAIRTCWNRVHRDRFAALRYGLLFVVLWSWLLYFLLAFLIPATPVLIPASLLYARRPLLVVAHPDDESLFFGPALLGLTKRESTTLNILVLSSGTMKLLLLDLLRLEHVRFDTSRKQLRAGKHPKG
jgi:GlcNAc-PI de-N-acetylase